MLVPFPSFETALFPQVSQDRPVYKQKEYSLSESDQFAPLHCSARCYITILLDNSIILVPKSIESNEGKNNKQTNKPTLSTEIIQRDWQPSTKEMDFITKVTTTVKCSHE